MTKHNLDVAAGDRLEPINDLRCELATLQERWENRFSSKHFHAFGEGYISGDLSFVLNFHEVPRIDVGKGINNSAGTNSECRRKDIIVHLINCTKTSNLAERKAGNDKVMLIDVIGLPDLPKAKVPTLVRFYDGEALKREQGERLHYSSVGWRTLTGFGRHKGLTQPLPAIVGWEVYASRIARFSRHQPRHDVLQRGAEAMKGVPNRKNHVMWNGSDGELERLFAGLKISIINDVVEVAFDVSGEPLLRLVGVAVGPIDL